MRDFAEFPLWVNLVLFTGSAVAVWVAGTRLSRYADAIARSTGIGHAVIGVLLLGGITSLPEIAVTGFASLAGNAALAVNNLLGGFAMQVAILALADIAVRRAALTVAVPDPIVLLQGTLGILLVAMVIAGIGAGDTAFAGAGLWTWGVLIAFIYSIRVVARAEASPSWKALGEPPEPQIRSEIRTGDLSGFQLGMATSVAGGVILVMGYLLSSSGEALAEITGMGDSFFGAVFVAISTSLPEISTVLAAIRLGRYVMAVSDIFGTNLFDIGVIFLVDLFYPGGPVLNEVGGFSIFAGVLGIAVTGIYLAGLIERRDVAVFGIGVDTIAVTATYLGGISILYTLR